MWKWKLGQDPRSYNTNRNVWDLSGEVYVMIYHIKNFKIFFLFFFFPDRSVDPHMWIKVLCFSSIFQTPAQKIGWVGLPVGWEHCFVAWRCMITSETLRKWVPMSDVTQSIKWPWSVFVLKSSDFTHSFKKFGHHRGIHPSSCYFLCQLLQNPHLVHERCKIHGVNTNHKAQFHYFTYRLAKRTETVIQWQCKMTWQVSVS